MATTPQTIDELIDKLSLDSDPVREAIASELGALQSIYGEDALTIWKPSQPGSRPSTPDAGTIHFEVTLSIDIPAGHSADESSHPINILVTLPPTYPSTSAPQLQLLSRYIGPYGVDAPLFGTVLRTFISRGGVEWTPDYVCVFDGLEWVKERCAEWLSERMSENKVGELMREDERGRTGNPRETQNGDEEDEGKPSSRAGREPPPVPAEMPPGITITEAEAIHDRKSVFIGRACPITDPSQVPLILDHIMSDRRISRAAHPIINAWRCKVGNILHQDNDDDGETAAGGRLAHLLQILEVDNVLVIVTRYFGGIHLGPDRFKHINQAARNALELGGFLDAPDEVHRGRKSGKARGHAK